eukprot:gene66-3564_t
MDGGVWAQRAGGPPPRARAAAGLLAALPAAAAVMPHPCQPREAHPFVPIFHIIGNITVRPKWGFTVAPINDVSA